MPQYDVFLSHHTSDADLAATLKDSLTAAKVSVWYDGAEIKLGDSVLAKMQEGIQRSGAGLILFTPAFLSTATGFRWAEVEAYLAEQLSSGRTSILPLLAGVSHEEYQQKLPLLRARRYERIALNDSGKVSKTELERVTQIVADAFISRALVKLVSRDDLNSIISGIEDRLSSIREVLMISGNDCHAIVVGKSAFLRKALDRGVKIKIMCVDPESSSAVETLTRIDPRFESAKDFIVSMQTVEYELRKLGSAYPGLFESRYMPVAPSVGLYISDPALPSALTKVEMYTPKPWNPVATRPHVIIKQDGMWQDYFLSSWENYWDMSRVVT